MEFIYQGNKLDIKINNLIIAGWAGRDPKNQQVHINELAALGVTPPVNTPTFYNVGKELLTHSSLIDVVGCDATGEVEYFLLKFESQIYIGVASDLTDRKVEANSIVLSKQICPKPISKYLWKYSEVIEHWDDLILRSYCYLNKEKCLYQYSSVSALLHPESLLASAGYSLDSFDEGLLMLGGTVPVKGNLQFSERMDLELIDPVLNRKICHMYGVRSL